MVYSIWSRNSTQGQNLNFGRRNVSVPPTIYFITGSITFMNIGQYVRNHALRKFAKRKIKKSFRQPLFRNHSNDIIKHGWKEWPEDIQKGFTIQGSSVHQVLEIPCFFNPSLRLRRARRFNRFFYREDSEQIELPPATALTWKNNCYK